VKGEVAKARFQNAYTAVQVGGIVVPVFRRALDTFDTLTWNAIVNNIDDTPNRATPVKQRGGSSQDLNAFRQQWFYGDSVVRAKTGNIRRRGIIL